MSKSEKYKQFAADCIRMAETLGGEDRERLLKIADVWTERALEAEATGSIAPVMTRKGQAMVPPGPNDRVYFGDTPPDLLRNLYDAGPPPGMSAIGGKADMPSCTAHVRF